MQFIDLLGSTSIWRRRSRREAGILSRSRGGECAVDECPTESMRWMWTGFVFYLRRSYSSTCVVCCLSAIGVVVSLFRCILSNDSIQPVSHSAKARLVGSRTRVNKSKTISLLTSQRRGEACCCFSARNQVGKCSCSQPPGWHTTPPYIFVHLDICHLIALHLIGYGD